MPIPFHLDENMPQAVADGLRKRGIGVTTATDAGLVGASDEQHLAFAQSARRVIVTRDVDFLRLNAAGIEHSGIVFCHVRSPVHPIRPEKENPSCVCTRLSRLSSRVVW